MIYINQYFRVRGASSLGSAYIIHIRHSHELSVVFASFRFLLLNQCVLTSSTHVFYVHVVVLFTTRTLIFTIIELHY